jgi:hypothetical protein
MRACASKVPIKKIAWDQSGSLCEDSNRETRTRQIERRPVACPHLGDFLPVSLQPAYAQFAFRWQQIGAVAGFQRAVQRRSGHDRAESAHRKNPVDVHAEPLARHPPVCGIGCRGYGGAKRVESNACHGRNPDHGRLFEKGARDKIRYFAGAQVRDIGRGQVDAGERDDAGFNAQQFHDAHVLAGLRHDAAVRRDGQKRDVDAVRAAYHGMDKVAVTGHVDDADRIAAL